MPPLIQWAKFGDLLEVVERFSQPPYPCLELVGFDSNYVCVLFLDVYVLHILFVCNYHVMYAHPRFNRQQS